MTLTGMVVAPLCFGQVAAAPMAAWHADGSTEDSSGNGNNGTAIGTARFAKGLSGQAFELNGRDEAVNTKLDTHPDNHPSMTWSAWILPRKLGAGKRQILSSDNGDYKRSLLIENGQFTVFTGGSSWRTPESAEAGTWQHVTVVFSPEEVRFYKNGAESIHGTHATTSAPVAELAIGCNPAFGEHFAGLIDEVEIYDRALAAEDISAIYEKLRAAAEATPAENTPEMSDEEAGNVATQTTNISSKIPGETLSVRPEPRATPEANPPHTEAPITPAPTVVQTPYAPSEAESPAVAKAIADNDPESLAKVLLVERWDSNLAADLSRPIPKLGGKLSRFKGRATLVAFCPYDKNFISADKEKAVGYFDPAIETALGPETKAGKLEVVIVAPDPAKDIEAVIAKRAPRGENPRISIIEDPDDELRRTMGLYSTPYLLFDTQGDLVWSVRVGQRAEGTGFGTPDLKTAVARVAANTHIKRAIPSAIIAPKREEEALFTFEDGASAWSLSGDAWRNGTSTDADFPGLVKGFEGRRFLSSFPPNGSPPTGIAVSPPFKISKRYLHMKVGGGDLPHKTGVALVCGGTTRLIAAGKNTFELNTVTWDLSELAGKTARLIAYDAGKNEMRDGIMIDAVFASNSPLPPASFAEHHDPNNQAHAARLAKDIPEDYRAFQNGEFHCEVTDGPTYLVEANAKFRVPKGGIVRISSPPFQETASQEVGVQGAEIVWGNRWASAKLIEKPRGTFSPKSWMIDCNDKTLKEGMEASVRFHAEITPKNFKFVRGSNTYFKPLTPQEREAIKKTRPDTFQPALLKLIKEAGLTKWPEENDSAFLLRVIRWMQRYWTNAAPWGGWPTEKGDVNREFKKKSMSCPAAGTVGQCLLANGIPNLAGQGMWLERMPDKELSGHVRILVFLEKVGWTLIDDDKTIYSPTGEFTFGRESANNYIIRIWDPTDSEFYGAETVRGLDGKWTSRIIQ